MPTQPVVRLVFALRPDAEATGDPFSGTISLRAGGRVLTLRATAAAASALQVLRGGTTAEAACGAATAVDPSWARADFHRWLDGLVRAGMVWRSIVVDGRPIVTVLRVAATPPPRIGAAVGPARAPPSARRGLEARPGMSFPHGDSPSRTARGAPALTAR